MKYGPSRFKHEIWVKPNAEARREARYFLKTRPTIPKSKRGATSPGVARAKSIAAGEWQPAREIAGWFARHLPYITAARRDGKRYEDSKSLQSAKAWGGEAMRSQAVAAVKAKR